MLPTDITPLEVTCPRCEANVVQRFHGPCEVCRRELRERFQAVGRDIEVAEYEPKMNVTPNAVALKDE
jgi:hypothetical protein